MAHYSTKQIISLFGSDIVADTLLKAENSNSIPKAKRVGKGSVKRRVWNTEDLPFIGERYGFLKKFKRPIALSVFITKGGVLKTSLTLNIARMAALHNIRTCVVGLDMQGDITSALGFDSGIDEADDISSALNQLNSVLGLNDLFNGSVTLDEILVETDLPTLQFIPETPELVQLDQSLIAKIGREDWLEENVILPLKQRYDLILMDCSPNWNWLITNALKASDILISPLECKINNFRNLKVFRPFINQFKLQAKKDFQHIFIPTRFTSTRKLSTEIRSHYMKTIEGCTNYAIREGVPMEESTASHVSLPEYKPNIIQSEEIRELLTEVWSRIEHQLDADESPTPHTRQAELTL